SSVAHLPQELDRLAFASRVAEPAALFSAPIAARCNLSAGCPTGVPIHGSPADNSVLPKGIAEGTPLRIVGARGKWLQVVLPNDERVWINLYHADFGPVEVASPPSLSVMLRKSARGPATGQLFIGRAPVISVHRISSRELWYQVSSLQGEGWVRADEVEPRFR